MAASPFLDYEDVGDRFCAAIAAAARFAATHSRDNPYRAARKVAAAWHRAVLPFFVPGGDIGDDPRRGAEAGEVPL